MFYGLHCSTEMLVTCIKSHKMLRVCFYKLIIQQNSLKQIFLTENLRSFHSVTTATNWNKLQNVEHRQTTPRDARKEQNISLPDFTDPRIAYKNKTFSELLRAYLVFRMCSYDWMVDNQSKILSLLERLLGQRMFRVLMKATIYKQFLAGETNQEVISRAVRDSAHGVLPMFAYTAAEVHGDVRSQIGRSELARLFETNVAAVHNSIEIAAKTTEGRTLRPKVSSKLTFLTVPETLENLTRVMWQQEHLVKTNTKLVGETLSSMHNVLPPTFTKPGPDDIVSLITNVPFHLSLYQKRKALGLKAGELELSEHTIEDIHTLVRQMDKLAEHAVRADVRLLWDAEQTYLQTAIDALVLDSMRRHNRGGRATVANTYQCYRKVTEDIVTRDLSLAEREGFCLGLKVVRGAYITEERRLAAEQGYEDPINPTYDATTDMYYRVVETLLTTLQSSGTEGKPMVVFATHNLDTVTHIVNRLRALGVSPVDGNHVAFAQLLGMRDHITYPLASTGLPASKLYHYGPVLGGVAYLSRRVTENRGGVATAGLERSMLAREIRRRVVGGRG